MLTTKTQTFSLPNDILVKIQIPATIQTVTQRIVGNIHIREWERVKDSLNNLGERFIAVTDADVYNFQGQALQHCAFMAINVDHIVWINPNDLTQCENDQNGETDSESY
jgi:hypothetical protein